MARQGLIVGIGVMAAAAALVAFWLSPAQQPPERERPVLPPPIQSPEAVPGAPPPATVPEVGDAGPPAEPSPPPAAASSPRPPAVTSAAAPRFARLQSRLNQAAAGRLALAAAGDHGADPFDPLAQALDDILAGDALRAESALDAVETAVQAAIPSERRMAASPALAERQEWLVSYYELLPVTRRGGTDPLAAAFVRLAVMLRKADAVLLAGMLPRLTGYDLVSRRYLDAASSFDGRGLRLPCRLAADHRPWLIQAARVLGAVAGTLTDCPLASGREGDFAQAERLARDPAAVLTPPPVPAPVPDPQTTPLMRVAASGSFAAIEAALAQGGDPTRADERGRTALHYLLGNRALSGADRARAVALLF